MILCPSHHNASKDKKEDLESYQRKSRLIYSPQTPSPAPLSKSISEWWAPESWPLCHSASCTPLLHIHLLSKHDGQFLPSYSPTTECWRLEVWTNGSDLVVSDTQVLHLSSLHTEIAWDWGNITLSSTNYSATLTSNRGRKLLKLN